MMWRGTAYQTLVACLLLLLATSSQGIGTQITDCRISFATSYVPPGYAGGKMECIRNEPLHQDLCDICLAQGLYRWLGTFYYPEGEDYQGPVWERDAQGDLTPAFDFSIESISGLLVLTLRAEKLKQRCTAIQNVLDINNTDVVIWWQEDCSAARSAGKVVILRADRCAVDSSGEQLPAKHCESSRDIGAKVGKSIGSATMDDTHMIPTTIGVGAVLGGVALVAASWHTAFKVTRKPKEKDAAELEAEAEAKAAMGPGCLARFCTKLSDLIAGTPQPQLDFGTMNAFDKHGGSFTYENPMHRARLDSYGADYDDDYDDDDVINGTKFSGHGGITRGGAGPSLKFRGHGGGGEFGSGGDA